MARGRKPKPTSVLKLEGSWRSDRHGGDEPRPSGTARKPRGLSKNAARLWDKVVPQLASMGLATRLDAVMLEAMCQWYSMYLEQTDVTKRATCWKMFDSIAAKFGMTPSDRAKLRGHIDLQAKDETEKFLA